MKPLSLLLAVALPCLLISTAKATTIIPFRHLGEAVSTAPVVVSATALFPTETSIGQNTFTDWHFSVDKVIKGAVIAGQDLVLRPYSFRTPAAKVQFDVAGDFTPEAGTTYLLFLSAADGVWKPVTLSYYIMALRQKDGASYFVPIPECFGFSFVGRPDGIQPEPLGVYPGEMLVAELQAFAQSGATEWSNERLLTGLTPNDFVADRAIPTDCDYDLSATTTNICRWQNSNVGIYFDDTNVPAGFNSTLSTILTAMHGSYTGINPTNAGQVSFTPNCSDGSITGSDFISYMNGLSGTQGTLIIFDDPCAQIPDLSSCTGTLAIGGGYSSSSTHVYKGDTWKNAMWGYVVVNNGSLACLNSTQQQQLFIHELTHTFRMDHLSASTYPNQNMNPSCCNSIGSKDLECMNYMYDVALPVEIVVFHAKMGHQNNVVQLAWQTAAEANNDHFILERSTDGIRFDPILTVAASPAGAGASYDTIDDHPMPGLNYYRLSQVDRDGAMHHLGIEAVTNPTSQNVLGVFPNPVGSNMPLQVNLSLAQEFDGTMQCYSAEGQLVHTEAIRLEKGNHRLQVPVTELPNGLYVIRIQSTQLQLNQRFIKN